MVINLYIKNWNVKRVLIDQGSSTDILYWDAFQGLMLVQELLQPFKGSLVGFSREQVHALGYIAMRTTFRNKEISKTIKVR